MCRKFLSAIMIIIECLVFVNQSYKTLYRLNAIKLSLNSYYGVLITNKKCWALISWKITTKEDEKYNLALRELRL